MTRRSDFLQLFAGEVPLGALHRVDALTKANILNAIAVVSSETHHTNQQSSNSTPAKHSPQLQIGSGGWYNWKLVVGIGNNVTVTECTIAPLAHTGVKREASRSFETRGKLWSETAKKAASLYFFLV